MIKIFTLSAYIQICSVNSLLIKYLFAHVSFTNYSTEISLNQLYKRKERKYQNPHAASKINMLHLFIVSIWSKTRGRAIKTSLSCYRKMLLEYFNWYKNSDRLYLYRCIYKKKRAGTALHAWSESCSVFRFSHMWEELHRRVVKTQINGQCVRFTAEQTET